MISNKASNKAFAAERKKRAPAEKHRCADLKINEMHRSKEVAQIDRQQINFRGNKTHLNILFESIDKDTIRIWNDWRSNNPSEIPNLRGIKLIGVNLTGYDFNTADLRDADLTDAKMNNCDLNGVALTRATLVRTRFIHAAIYSGMLKYANLQNANLDGAVLNNAVLSKANLTGAIIRGLSKEGWEIDGIQCDYVYQDHEGKVRIPAEGIFDEGEFEKLYRHSPRIEYIFIDEFTYIDILIMDKVVQEINVQNPEYKLKLDCFHARGKPRAEFVIKSIEDSQKILDEIKRKHEDEKREFTLKLEHAGGELKAYKEILFQALREPKFLIESMHIEDNKSIWLNLQTEFHQKREKLSIELSELRKVLQNAPNSIDRDKSIGALADAEEAAKVGDGPGVVEHLKKVGKWVLGISTNIGTNIATEFIKKSMGL